MMIRKAKGRAFAGEEEKGGGKKVDV